MKMSGCQASEDLNLKVKTKDSTQDFLLQEESGRPRGVHTVDIFSSSL